MRYIRSHAAELNVNPERIGAIGSSAGGQLALMLGTTGTKEFPISGEDINVSSAVKVVVSLAGPTDLTKEMPGESEATVKTPLAAKLVWNVNFSPYEMAAMDSAAALLTGTAACSRWRSS